MTMKYEGTETVQGLRTYRFVGSVPATMTGTLSVPSKVLGEPEGEMLTAENWYANDRTYWVEPETGVIMDASESQDTTLRYNGEERVVATRGTTGYPDEQTKANIDEYKPLASQLHLLRVVLPIAGLVGGLLALLAGALLVLTGRKTSAEAEETVAA